MAVVDRKVTAGPGEGPHMTDGDMQDLLDELWQAGSGGMVVLHADTTWWRRRVKRMWATVEREPEPVAPPEPAGGLDHLFRPRPEDADTDPPKVLAAPAIPAASPALPGAGALASDAPAEDWRPGQLGTWPGPPANAPAPMADGGAGSDRPTSNDRARPASHRKARSEARG